MLFYTTLFLVFWALIFTAARFLQYFRIVKNYKEETQATVTQIRDHEPVDGEERSSEIIVPRQQAERYQVGSRVGIRYYAEENGAVHIASAGDAPRKIMFAYLALIVLEIVIYAVIWKILL